MEKSASYIKRKEAQLATWQQKVHELVQNTKVASGQVKSDMQFEVDDLKAKCAAAQEKLEALKTLGNEKWDALTDDVDSTWKELSTSFKNQTNGKAN